MVSLQPATPDMIERNVGPVASTMNGSWKFDKTRSDSVVPFLKHLGISWAIQKVADFVTPSRTFNLTSTGMVDQQVLTGMMNKTEQQEWAWSENIVTLPVIGSFPGFLTFDSEGRLVTRMMHTKGLVLTVFEHVVREGNLLVLKFRMMVLDPSNGQELVGVQRVFYREG